MSYLTILGLTPNDTVNVTTEIQELQNARGFHFAVWDPLLAAHLNVSGMHRLEDDKEFWRLWKDPSVPLAHRAVLLMTYDRAYVERKDYERAANDIREFLKTHPAAPDRVNHLPALADFFDSKPDFEAIGFSISLGENLFEQYDEESDEYIALQNWDETYSVYSSFDGESA